MIGADEIAKRLVAAGANLRLRNKAGKTPAELAAENGYTSLASEFERWIAGAACILPLEVFVRFLRQEVLQFPIENHFREHCCGFSELARSEAFRAAR